MGFKRAFKKFRKAVGIPALTLGNAAKAGAIVATGGVGGLATGVVASKLKSAAIGTLKNIARAKAQKALAKRLVKLAPAPRPVAASAESPATTMPGGAPLAKPRRARRRAAAAPRAKKSKTVQQTINSGRRPPKGGKDLKALAAAWRAAGKPGKWIDWVKSH